MRSLAIVHATAAATFAIVAPLSLLAKGAELDAVIGLAALAAVVVGAVARVRPPATALGIGVLLVYFGFASVSSGMLRTAAALALAGAATAYAGYVATASLGKLSTGAHSP